MARRPYAFLRLLLPAVFLLLGCPAPVPPVETVTTFGLGGYLTPGSEAHFLAVLPTSIKDEARADHSIEVYLQQPGSDAELVYRGRTDATGAAQVVFDVPDAVTNIDPLMDPTTRLSFSIDAGSGSIFAQRSIILADVSDVLLTTDKPIYQPGQVLHMRGLALNRATMAATADTPVTFSVMDPTGNIVLRQAVATSSFGIAAVDLPLSEQAPTGNYTLEARLGDFRVQTTVEVKPYTLPRFKVEFNPARDWYLPGEVVTGTVAANYFFGKPVAGGTVSMQGYVTDVERVEAITLAGETDANGVYTFTFTMPESFIAQPDETELRARTATLDILIEVTDKAQHRERIEEEMTVAEHALLVEASPEAGSGLITGADNLLYVDVSYPDGSPAQAGLTIASDALAEPISITTDAAGLAVMTLPADAVARAVPSARFTINAVDVANPELVATRRVRLTAAPGLLLRTDAVEYTVGDTMQLDVFAPPDVDDVFISVEKNGESHAFATLPVVNGVAQGELPVDGALQGTLALQAYGATRDGQNWEATRYVLVNPPATLLDVQADAPEYLPGGQARVDVQVSQAGVPLPAALGISVVDESVYALGESDPGFARTFFLLARALQEPRFGITGFSDLADDAQSPYDPHILNTALPARTPASADSSRSVALAGYLAQQGSATATTAAGLHAAPVWAGLWAYGARLPFALPLLGIALYDGTRKRRRLLLALVIAALATGLLVSCAAPALAPAAPASAPAGEAAAAPAGMETTATRGGVAPPRLRQFFPETLLWLPELKTDAEGKAQIDVALADTITTWRMSIVASDRAGNLGSATIGLRAFQGFFVEPDLPTRLTVDDELELPVSIYNYQDSPQEVQLQVEPAAWFTFTAAPPASVSVAANDVTVAYIPLRVVGFGEQTLRIDAQSATLADAVLRPITVVPNGEPQAQSSSGTLRSDAATIEANIPGDSLASASSVTFKVYPGALSQMTDGLAALIQQPHGCFEQVTSTLYPAVLALETLRRGGVTDSALERRASDIMLSGYQQLLSYEVDGFGGFSYWGDPPPQSDLTAWGIMEFSDMARVAWVDPALVERTANYLMAQQQWDGSWTSEYLSGSYATNLSLRSTAWVVWALADAGYTDTLAVQRGLDYMWGQLMVGQPQPQMQPQPRPLPQSSTPGLSGGSTAGQGRPSQPPQPDSPLAPPALMGFDMYTMAMVANAFQSAGLDAKPYLDLLASQAQPAAKAINPYGMNSYTEGVVWSANATAWTGANGYWADVDTSAMATYALMRDGRYDAVAHAGLDWLLSQRNPGGMVGTTQGTVFMLKSLLLTVEELRGDTTITFTRSDTGEQQVMHLPENGTSVVQELYFAGLEPGITSFDVAIDGPQRPAWQMVVNSYRPWPETGSIERTSMRLDVVYDRTELVVNDTVQATATVELLAPGGANMLLVRLGIPPGFNVLREDWQALVANGVISDYELGAHEVRAYLSRVATNQPIAMSYRLQARLPVRVNTPGATAYDYYRPDQRDDTGPVLIIVRRDDN